jgi:hypothetical protein
MPAAVKPKSKIEQLIEWISEANNLAAADPTPQLQLLFKGTRDGFGADIFHTQCDN